MAGAWAEVWKALGVPLVHPAPAPTGPLNRVEPVAEQVPVEAGPVPDLSEEDRRTLWEQFAEVYAHSQEAWDSSIRTLGAAGIGVTASIGTALHSFSAFAIVAVAAYIASVVFNLFSYGTAQLDMRCRLRALRNSRAYEGAERSRWTKYTTVLNLLAGAAFVVGSAFLAVFVAAAT